MASRRALKFTAAAGALLLAAVLGFAYCEARGWPFLADPVRKLAVGKLDRGVDFNDTDGHSSFSLKLWGSPRLTVQRLQIDNLPGLDLGPMLIAQDVLLSARWSDILKWIVGPSGGAPRLASLSSSQLDLQIQRKADGRASWQFGKFDSAKVQANPGDAVQIDEWQLRKGTVRYVDELLQVDVDGRFAEGDTDAGGLQASAKGSYRKRPLVAVLSTATVPHWLSRDPGAPAVPVALRLSVGRAALRFDGDVRRPLGQRELRGRFHVDGPSLAAVGDAIGLTLPQTSHFSIDGLMAQAGSRWQAVVSRAAIGASLLDGAFTYDRPPGVQPVLAGRLHATNLLMQDLGPAVGGATEDLPKTTRARGRVLPDRSFDLPSLRAMDANILIDFDRFDFGTPQLQPASPLRAHLVLQKGKLGIEDLDAGLAQGRLSGHLRLDGSANLALWDIDLRGRGLVLEQWIKPVQRAKGAPYATGVLAGRVTLTGKGKSTAALLGSADGRVQVLWTRGTVSHLVVEAAGLDLAQALGVAIKGDDALPVVCGAGDLTVSQGRMTPTVLLVDTTDSTIWMDGQLSMADEQLALVAHVQPRDWSPLSLRTPVRIEGAWSNPTLKLEKGPLLKRVVPAALLGMLNPLAALLPLMDLPGKDAATQTCAQTVRARKSLGAS